MATLLLELGCEELPPHSLATLAHAFADNIGSELHKLGFQTNPARALATPRRLAVLIENLPATAPSQNIERFGPQVSAAYHDDGTPRPAALGFARACGVDLAQISHKSDGKAEKLYFCQQQQGATLDEVIQNVLDNALGALPIAKKMRWGANDFAFVRPVKWLLAMHGERVLPCAAFNLQAGNQSRGHRFHHPDFLRIPSADDYIKTLQAAYVLVDMGARQAAIQAQVQAMVASLPAGTQALMPPTLLAEVNALVEYPQAILCQFDPHFLQVPKEALIATMQDNQKYFALQADNGDLLPKFIAIANIDSQDKSELISGNERVISPRLADAQFFYQQDLKSGLESWYDGLANILFEQKLGTLQAKSARLAQVAAAIASQIGADANAAARAAKLCKCDLLSNMVSEFANMQGIAGRYYAQAGGELPEVAQAIEEHYLPRHAGDALPESVCGICLALGDKIDTLLGIWAAGLAPTGSKDPYALRRTALGIIRILAEKQLPLSITALLDLAHAAYTGAGVDLNFAQACEDIGSFISERLRGYALDLGYSAHQFAAVAAVNIDAPYDFVLRLAALKQFAHDPAAPLLANANKRCANILGKAATALPAFNPDLLIEPAERDLSQALIQIQHQSADLLNNRDYNGALLALAAAAPQIDAFFAEVMVMVDDAALCQNRLALLAQLQHAFTQVADLSQLS